MILDGAIPTSKDMQNLASCLTENKKIVISSRQLFLKWVGLPHVQLPAWTLEDILSASEDTNFYEQTVLWTEEKKLEEENRKKPATVDMSVRADIPKKFDEQTVDEEKFDRKKFITDKFSLTGGTPHLVFELSPRDVEAMLVHALNLLDLDQKRQVLFGELEPARDPSQNPLILYLIQYFVNPRVTEKTERYNRLTRKFSSQFVLRKLQTSLDVADLRTLYMQCQALNRAMECWAFEELMLRKLSEQPGQTS